MKNEAIARILAIFTVLSVPLSLFALYEIGGDLKVAIIEWSPLYQFLTSFLVLLIFLFALVYAISGKDIFELRRKKMKQLKAELRETQSKLNSFTQFRQRNYQQDRLNQVQSDIYMLGTKMTELDKFIVASKAYPYLLTPHNMKSDIDGEQLGELGPQLRIQLGQYGWLKNCLSEYDAELQAALNGKADPSVRLGIQRRYFAFLIEKIRQACEYEPLNGGEY